MQYVRISGVGAYLPERLVTNQDLEKKLDTSDSWILTRTGISRRHIAAEGELTSDLATKAAEKALKAANYQASDIDLLILATATPDHTFPATATRVQANLGTQGMAFDMAAVCSGFLFALATADSYLRQGLARKALVVGAETMSRLVDWEDRSTAVLFGDGAGAVVLDLAEKPGIMGHILRTDGAGYDYLKVAGGASSSEAVGKLQMNGREVFKKAVVRLEEVTRELLKAHDVTADEIDVMVPHQANVRIIQAVADRLEFPLEKIILTVQDHANTSSASIPLALDVGIKSGRVKPGQLILMNAFAAGFAWGGTLLRFQ